MKKKIISFIVFPLFVCAAAYAQGITWTPAQHMNKARAFFAAAQLQNGNVLVAGGYDATASPINFKDAEIYDWHTGVWTTVASMNKERAAAVAVVLENGDVMVIGGADENFNFHANAEIYDVANNTWTLTAPMNGAHFEDFTAVVLPGRKVLVAGGSNGALSLAEIYDQKTDTWTTTGSLNVGRGEFATVVLNDGRVMVVGGEMADGITPIASAEIYDPKTGTWSLTGSLITARNDLALVELRDGRVLAAGGGMGSEEFPRNMSAEIFDPHTGTWTPTGPMTIPRSEVEYASVLLPDGRVLVPGGQTMPHRPVTSAELYDPKTGTWTAAGDMSIQRAGHFSIVLNGNRGVLVMGGEGDKDYSGSTASVDIAVPK